MNLPYLVIRKNMLSQLPIEDKDNFFSAGGNDVPVGWHVIIDNRPILESYAACDRRKLIAWSNSSTPLISSISLSRSFVACRFCGKSTGRQRQLLLKAPVV